MKLDTGQATSLKEYNKIVRNICLLYVAVVFIPCIAVYSIAANDALFAINFFVLMYKINGLVMTIVAFLLIVGIAAFIYGLAYLLTANLEEQANLIKKDNKK